MFFENILLIGFVFLSLCQVKVGALNNDANSKKHN